MCPSRVTPRCLCFVISRLGAAETCHECHDHDIMVQRRVWLRGKEASRQKKTFFETAGCHHIMMYPEYLSAWMNLEIAKYFYLLLFI